MLMTTTINNGGTYNNDRNNKRDREEGGGGGGGGGGGTGAGAQTGGIARPRALLQRRDLPRSRNSPQLVRCRSRQASGPTQALCGRLRAAPCRSPQVFGRPRALHPGLGAKACGGPRSARGKHMHHEHSYLQLLCSRLVSLRANMPGCTHFLFLSSMAQDLRYYIHRYYIHYIHRYYIHRASRWTILPRPSAPPCPSTSPESKETRFEHTIPHSCSLLRALLSMFSRRMRFLCPPSRSRTPSCQSSP